MSAINVRLLNVHSSEGLIEIDNIKGQDATIKSAMGRLISKSSQFKDLYMKTEMGKVILEDVKSESYYLISELGSVNLSGLTADSNIKAVSKMGAVNVKYKKNLQIQK